MVAELGLERVGDLTEEVGLGHPAGLEHVQRVLPVALGDRLHRPAERLAGDPGLVLEGGERVDQRGRQDAAEVGDHRPDPRRSHDGRRMSSDPVPASPPARSTSAALSRLTPPLSELETRRGLPGDSNRHRVLGRVELQPDPSRLPVGPVLGRQQGLVELLERLGVADRAGGDLLAVALGAGGAQRRDRQQPPVVEPGGEHAHRLDLVPVELAAEPPDRLLAGRRRIEVGELVGAPLEPQRLARRVPELQRHRLTHGAHRPPARDRRSPRGRCPRSRSPAAASAGAGRRARRRAGTGAGWRRP